jgi:cellulose synthase/poly-beta-1,6-N-acetylglucosamine synthase-like glycosyltransferase
LLSSLVDSIGLLLCAGTALLLLPDAFLIPVHFFRSAAAIQRELAETQLTAFPRVSVHLAVFNEPALVERAIDALAQQEWPADSLEILVLDDSTDETASLAAARVTFWAAKGVRIEHVRRTDRTGYKAGALAEAFDRTDALFIAVFDVDYTPDRNFLTRTIPTLLAEPGAAFVQARLDFHNRDANRLTRAQALELDTFLAYEQAARNWAGVPMTFNGTCGVWRREAIADAGGWSGRSLVEDQDLSFRAFAKGWTCRNLVTVAVRGELPATLRVLVGQRARWASGTAQAFHDLPWGLLRHLEWYQASVFVLLAVFYSAFSLLLLATAVLAVVALLLGSGKGLTLVLALSATISLLILLKTIGAMLARRALGRPIGPDFLIDVISMWLMEAVLVSGVARALVRGFLNRTLTFHRTPKTGR